MKFSDIVSIKISGDEAFVTRKTSVTKENCLFVADVLSDVLPELMQMYDEARQMWHGEIKAMVHAKRKP